MRTSTVPRLPEWLGREEAPGSRPPAGALHSPLPPAAPSLPSIKLQWACVSARWQRAMCQEIIAIKNSLGFISSFFFFLGSVWALCFFLKKLPNRHPLHCFNCL